MKTQMNSEGDEIWKKHTQNAFSNPTSTLLEFTFHQNSWSNFSQTHKVGNIGIIANFVFLYICSFVF